jgi:hypothetical protein
VPWKAMFFDGRPFGPGGDHVGEPPRVRNDRSGNGRSCAESIWLPA